MNERSEGLRAELDKVGLECMLVTRIENVRYLTGFQGSNGAVLMTPDAALLMTEGTRLGCPDILRLHGRID